MTFSSTTTQENLHADAIQLVTNYHSNDPDQLDIRAETLALLKSHPDAMTRQCLAGHVTGSAVILNPDRREVLLHLHPKHNIWLQLGGHCEAGDTSVAATAQREAREESGIPDLVIDSTPIDLDIHPARCAGPDVQISHYDIRFLLLASNDAQPKCSDESLDLQWFKWDQLPAPLGRDVPRQVAAAVARLHQR